MKATEFNALHKVGALVFAYPGARPEDDASATRLVTRTRSEASVLSGHTDVVWVDGHSACIALSHVDVVPEDEWEAARTADAVRELGALPMPVGPGPSLLSTRTRELVDMEADRNRWKTEAERLKAWADSREARTADLFATMGLIDLRETPEAWALGMTVLSHLDGPPVRSTQEEREPGLLALIQQLQSRIAELEATAPLDRLTRTFAATQALREEAPDKSPAGLLAESLRTSQPDVTAAEVLESHVVRVTIRPESLAAWNWWQARFSVDVDTVTSRGSITTAKGRHGNVNVLFRAEGVAALQAKERGL